MTVKVSRGLCWLWITTRNRVGSLFPDVYLFFFNFNRDFDMDTEELVQICNIKVLELIKNITDLSFRHLRLRKIGRVEYQAVFVIDLAVSVINGEKDAMFETLIFSQRRIDLVRVHRLHSLCT